MTKEDLIRLREEIRGLSEEELFERDIYLRDLNNGIIQGPMIGNPYIDRPWLKWYDYNNDIIDLNDTLYNTYKKSVEDRLDEISVYVNSSKKSYTNREIISMIDEASKGFLKLGLKENSKVGIFLNGSVEEVVTFLALNKIGVISKYIDYMKSVTSMAENVEQDNLDLLIMDECFLPIESYINKKGLKVIVANSDKKYNDGNLLSYDYLYELGKDIDVKSVSFNKDSVRLIINSSGTTGHPKPICHSDYSINAAVSKMLHTDYPVGKGNVVIKMIPSQIGLGLITSLYTGLISGAQVILIGETDKMKLVNGLNSFVKNFDTYKKGHNLSNEAKINVFTAPAFIRCLVEDTRVDDLSSIGSLLGAGSKMSKEELDYLSEIAKNKGCRVPICNGYGQNEMAGAITLNSVGHNINGSAGFPTYGTDILVINPDTFDLLDVNENGLIIEKSTSKFLCYENMPTKTKESEIVFSDGSKWFNTFDLGYMDSNGFIYITGRTTRVVIREDFKISLDDVENKIRVMNGVKDCATISTTSGGSLEEITVFVEGTSKLLDLQYFEKMFETSKELSAFELPTHCILIDQIPYKDNGKIDYKRLDEMFKEQKNDFKEKILKK